MTSLAPSTHSLSLTPTTPEHSAPSWRASGLGHGAPIGTFGSIPAVPVVTGNPAVSLSASSTTLSKPPAPETSASSSTAGSARAKFSMSDIHNQNPSTTLSSNPPPEKSSSTVQPSNLNPQSYAFVPHGKARPQQQNPDPGGGPGAASRSAMHKRPRGARPPGGPNGPAGPPSQMTGGSSGPRLGPSPHPDQKPSIPPPSEVAMTASPYYYPGQGYHSQWYLPQDPLPAGRGQDDPKKMMELLQNANPRQKLTDIMWLKAEDKRETSIVRSVLNEEVGSMSGMSSEAVSSLPTSGIILEVYGKALAAPNHADNQIFETTSDPRTVSLHSDNTTLRACHMLLSVIWHEKAVTQSPSSIDSAKIQDSIANEPEDGPIGEIRLSQMEREDHSRIQYALQKDEATITSLLAQILVSTAEKQAALNLKGVDVGRFMHIMEIALDTPSFWKESTGCDWRRAHRLFVKLAQMSNTLPHSLFVHGVKCIQALPVAGGAFADIYQGTYHGKEVALKRIRQFQLVETNRDFFKTICREALVWKQLNHPFVLPFFGVDCDIFPGLLCMVSPWMPNGTILEHLALRRQKMTGPATAITMQYALEIAQGIKYLHSLHIVHGDLRGSNILIDDQQHVRLADFGLSSFVAATTVTQTTRRGSTRWMAPELLFPEDFDLGKFERTFASDVYAFGCVCIEVFTGNVPFAEIPEGRVLFEVACGVHPNRPAEPMSDDMWETIQASWSRTYRDRPSAAELVRRIRSEVGVISLLLDPSRRRPTLIV